MTYRESCDLIVVGAGPAGLAAATAAAECGLATVLLDTYARPGGQYFMQGAETSSAAARSWQMRQGAGAIARAEAAGARILRGAEVWAIFPGFSVHAWDERRPIELRADTVLIATGAHDRTVAFPGWTLPGVMTPGAAQRLAKTSGTPPGERSLLAGSGPFLLPVAGAVLKAGGHLVEIVEARTSYAPMLRQLARYPEKWPEALRLLKPLLAARTPRRFGEVVVAARGDGRVEEAELAPLDSRGHPDLSRSRRVAGIDSLLVGYGFRPQTELTSLLGCEHGFDENFGGWRCVTDPSSGATSVAGVYAAGETTGIGGAEPAKLSGAIAGLAIVEAKGGASTAARRHRLGRRLRRAARFADAINRAFPIPAGLDDLLGDETVVCRCEDVTAGEVRSELQMGADDYLGVKLWTRAGMGPCQGRICQASLICLLAAQTGKTPQEIGYNAPRIPVRPVPLSVVKEALDGTTET